MHRIFEGQIFLPLVIFIHVDRIVYWFWIGSHAEYDELLKRM